MKNLCFILVVGVLLGSCASVNRTGHSDFDQEIIGESEWTILSKLGPPHRVTHNADGEKVLIYEHYSKGMFLTPYKSKVSLQHGIILSGDKYKVTNDPKYTVYQSQVSYLKLFLDKEGKCVRCVHTLPQEQLDIYHHRFKHMSPIKESHKKTGR